MVPLGDYATNITIKLEGEGKKLLEQIDKLLSNSEYASINKAIESYKRAKKRKERKEKKREEKEDAG